MPILKNISQVGVAKQTAKGTPAGSPTYGFGIADGTIQSVELTQDADTLTVTSGRTPTLAFRERAQPGAVFSTRAWPRSSALLAYAALGAVTTTGAGPYTHTVTPGNDLPYVTVFGQLGTYYGVVEDAKVVEASWRWERTRPVEVAATFNGTTPKFGVAAWTATNDEKNQVQFQGNTSGVFQVDTGSGTPATAPISAGQIRIQNAIAPVELSSSITPDDVIPGAGAYEISLTLVPDNVESWRKIITGSASGTAVSAAPVYGSFNVKFEISANATITFNATRISFNADFPASDAAGGITELEVVGNALTPVAGSALTITVVNDLTAV